MTKRKYDPEIISKRIKAARAKKGWTQADLANAAGVGLSTIKQYEAKKRTPEKYNLNRIASALGVYEDWLIGENKHIWHDLRLDPNDLPAEDELVMVCEEHEGKLYYGVARHKEYWTINMFYPELPFGEQKDIEKWKQLAWKHIEPFEGGDF